MRGPWPEPQVLLAASWHRASGAAPAPWLQCRRPELPRAPKRRPKSGDVDGQKALAPVGMDETYEYWEKQ